MSNGDSSSLTCPSCASQKNRVLDTRPTKRERCLKRRRLCEECLHVFSTIEVPFDCLKHQYTKDVPDIKTLLEFADQVNWKSIFLRYVDQVVRSEGTTLMSDSEFSIDELEEINKAFGREPNVPNL